MKYEICKVIKDGDKNIYSTIAWTDVLQYAKMIIADLNERLADRNLTIELTRDAESFIIEQAYDPVYGARPLKRYIQKYVETLAAKLILADKVRGGDTIVIELADNELVAEVK